MTKNDVVSVGRVDRHNPCFQTSGAYSGVSTLPECKMARNRYRRADNLDL